MLFQVFTWREPTPASPVNLPENLFRSLLDFSHFKEVRTYYEGGHGQGNPSGYGAVDNVLRGYSVVFQKWEDLKGCFNEETVKLFEFAKRFEAEKKADPALAKQPGVINSFGYFNFYATNVENPSDFRLGFKDAEGFLKFNEIIGKDLNEEQKVALLAFWLGDMGNFYNYSRKEEGLPRLFKSYPGQDALGEYVQGKDTGVCGDINGSAAHLLANRLGLEQSPLVVSTPQGAHVVSLVKGKKGYYAADYSEAKYAGKNIDAALDIAFSMNKRFSPFGGGGFRGTAFEESATGKMLNGVMGITSGEIKKGFSASLNADSYRSSGFSASYGLENMRVGAFLLNAPLSLSSFGGVSLDYKKSNEETGHIFLPHVSLAAMYANTAGESYPLLLAQVTPYLYRNRIGDNVKYEVSPLSIGGSTTDHFSESVLSNPTSSLGVIMDFGKGGKKSEAFVNASLRVVTSDENLYDVRKLGVTPKITAGFRNEDNEISLSYKPDSIGNLADLYLSHGQDIGPLNVLLTFNAKLLEKIPGEKPKLVDGGSIGVCISFLR